MKTVGTAQECLQRYLDAGGEKALARISEFMRIPGNRVKSWAKNGDLRGENLLRLWYFLEKYGFSLPELSSLNGDVYKLGKLIAFRKVKLQDASIEVGYPTDELLRKLMGKMGVVEERKKRMLDIIERFPETEEKHLGGMATIENRNMESKNGTVEKLAQLIRDSIPLSERVNSDEFDQKDRDKLRELTGSDGIFRLSNLLNSLCGERARDLYREKQIGGRENGVDNPAAQRR